MTGTNILNALAIVNCVSLSRLSLIREQALLNSRPKACIIRRLSRQPKLSFACFACHEKKGRAGSSVPSRGSFRTARPKRRLWAPHRQQLLLAYSTADILAILSKGCIYYHVSCLYRPTFSMSIRYFSAVCLLSAESPSGAWKVSISASRTAWGIRPDEPHTNTDPPFSCSSS